MTKVVRQSARHYVRHEWHWTYWLGLLAFGVLLLGIICK